MLEFSLLLDFFFTTVEIFVYTKRKFTLNKRKVRLQEIKKLNFVKIQFNHNRSSVTHPEQFSCIWEAVQVLCFFWAEILPIKIISICPSCTSKLHKYLIYNDMSLFSFVSGIMPTLNHHSHAKFKSLAYGRRSYCLVFLKMIPKPCKIWKHHLDNKVVQFEYLSNGISFTSFLLVI
jgi:hypothetical protein